MSLSTSGYKLQNKIETLESELKKSQEETVFLNTFLDAVIHGSRSILKYQGFKETARSLFDTCKKQIGAQSGYVALLSADGKENEVLFLDSGGFPCSVDHDLPMPIRGLRGSVYTTAEPAFENDFENSKWIDFMPKGHVQLKNVMFAPLVHDGKTVGLLGLANKPSDFDQRDARIASVFGKLAAIALRDTRRIDEIKRADTTLKHSESKLKSLFNTMNEGVCVHEIIYSENGDPVDYRILDVNPAYENISGIPRETALNEKASELYSIKDLPFLDTFARVADTLQPAAFEIFWPPMGKYFLISVFSPQKGQFATVFSDITDQKDKEEMLRLSEENISTTLNSIGDAVISTDNKGRIVRMNPVAEQLTGWSQLEAQKQPLEFIFKIVNQKTRRKVESPVNKVLKEGVSVGLPNHTILISKDEKEYFIDDSGAPIKDSDGKVIGIVIIFRDITAKYLAMEKQLIGAHKMESIGNLAGGIAHDFNNILFPIVGMSELLLEDLPAGSLEHQNVKEILHAGKRGRDLVKQILIFSHQTEQKKLPVRVQRILKEVINFCRPTIPINIKITQDIQPDCCPIKADPTQLHQVVLNLMTNAYHAIEGRNGEISIVVKEIILEYNDSLALTIGSGKYVRLSISDTGYGIDPNILEKIFEPYFTTKEQNKGTGLGLAVVYRIIKDHRGDIQVVSKVGKGTTFHIYLPLFHRSEESSAFEEAVTLEGGTEHIILVDDEKPIVHLEKQILERLGYRVTPYLNSIEALDSFKSNPNKYDLVVTDMAMPNMTGDELAKEIFCIKPGMPIIICTGFSEKISKRNAESIGIKGFLMKPIVKSELAQMVRMVLDRIKNADQE